MRFFLLIIISISIFAKTPYSVLESEHNKAVKLWENGKNIEAFSIFKKNNEENYIPSKYYIGLYYLYGFNTVKISYSKAFDYINDSSETGYINAMLQNSILYYYGIGTVKDKTKAKRILNKIALYFNMFDETSKSYLITIKKFNFTFLGVKLKKTRVLLKESIKSKNRLSKVNLIFYLRTHPYFFRRFTEATSILKEELKKGNVEAQALFYEQYSIKKRALKFLLAAAKQGDVNSQYNLYLHYKRKKNKRKKIKWLRIAANNGDKTARRILRRSRY